MNNYLFTSNRLGFRTWNSDDIEALHALNSDPEVMKYFPSTLSKADSESYIAKMNRSFAEDGFCYFAVEELATRKVIGFIGLKTQTFESEFTPAVDIGWRINKSYWGNGYATEGAKACIQYGFQKIGLSEIISTAPIINTPSIAVMEKIGMRKVKEFYHPLLQEDSKLNPCVLYKLTKTRYLQTTS